MSGQQEIADKMAQLRAAGTLTAERLPEAWERATDWQEYVRAYPLQAVGAAVAIGYLLIPKRTAAVAAVSAIPAAAVAADSLPRSLLASATPPATPAAGGGLLRAALRPLQPWLIGLAQQTAQRVVMTQIHQFTNKLMQDVAPPHPDEFAGRQSSQRSDAAAAQSPLAQQSPLARQSTGAERSAGRGSKGR